MSIYAPLYRRHGQLALVYRAGMSVTEWMAADENEKRRLATCAALRLGTSREACGWHWDEEEVRIFELHKARSHQEAAARWPALPGGEGGRPEQEDITMSEPCNEQGERLYTYWEADTSTEKVKVQADYHLHGLCGGTAAGCGACLHLRVASDPEPILRTLAKWREQRHGLGLAVSS